MPALPCIIGVGLLSWLSFAISTSMMESCITVFIVEKLQNFAQGLLLVITAGS